MPKLLAFLLAAVGSLACFAGSAHAEKLVVNLAEFTTSTATTCTGGPSTNAVTVAVQAAGCGVGAGFCVVNNQQACLVAGVDQVTTLVAYSDEVSCVVVGMGPHLVAAETYVLTLQSTAAVSEVQRGTTEEITCYLHVGDKPAPALKSRE